MSLPTLLDATQRLTDAIYYGNVPISSVPPSRNIFTTAPITGGGNLSADLTLALTTSPAAGAIAVATGRLINATSPMTVNGGASHDLSADLTLAVPQFAGTTAGLVPTGTNNATLFLSQTGWVTGTTAGVAQALAGPGISLSPSGGTGNVTFTNTIASITTLGGVPATGGTDPTKFLCMTNPISWQTAPGAGSPGILLQASTPGTDQVGHGHISGVFIADSALVAGSTNKSLNGSGNENFYLKQNSPSNPGVIASYFTGSQSAGFLYRVARGTEASPSNTAINDELVSFQVAPWQDSVYDQREFFAVTQRAAKSTHTPFDIDLQAQGSIPGQPFSQLRLGGNALSGIGTPLNTVPVNGWEIQTSLGLKLVSQTATFTVDDTGLMFNCDCTAGQIIANIQPASGRQYRTYGFRKVDTTKNSIVITPSGGLINGLSSWELFGFGEFCFVISDGTNWFTIADNRPNQQITRWNITDQLSNFTGPTAFATGFAIPTTRTFQKGGRFRGKFWGSTTCTGTPTLDLQLTFAGTVISDSRAYTLPNNLSPQAWQCDYSLIIDESGSISNYGTIWYFPSSSSGPPYPLAVLHSSIQSATFTGAGPIGMQATFSAASSSNQVSIIQAFMEYVPPGTHS